METNVNNTTEPQHDANNVLVAGWVNLPEMPKENEENTIYSERIIFKTKKCHEFKGWVRFDFECFVVKDRQYCFEYNEVDSWKYDTASS